MEVGVNLENMARPGDFPLGSPESRAAARMKLTHRHDNRKRVQFISNVCSPSPIDGSVDDSTRFHFSAWLECEDGSLFRSVCWPGVWLKLGDTAFT